MLASSSTRADDMARELADEGTGDYRARGDRGDGQVTHRRSCLRMYTPYAVYKRRDLKS